MKTELTRPTIIRPDRHPFSLSLRFLGGVVLTLALALAIFVAVMKPPMEDFQAMTQYLAITAVISVIAGIGVYRFGWFRFSPSIRWTILSSYALSALLTFVNVWTTARLMFINWHDLTLATILLVFAAGIALALGFFVTSTISDRVVALSKGAQAVAHGDLRVRVDDEGRDEVARLGHTFNEMALRLDGAARKQQELDSLRRELIAWVGHDLRTPLASVRAIVEALADGVVDDAATRDRYLRTAKRDIGALSLLIDDLFEMAQIDAGGIRLDRQPVAISDLISDTLESFSAQATDKSIRLGGGVAQGVDPVFCDARQIGRVLTNLIGNAIRHTPAGGTVEARARLVGTNVEISVVDNGEGIRHEDLVHVFERFYRSEKSRSRETGGAGLGLAIAKGIIEAHDGEIRVESRWGEGTRFVFSIPQAPGRKNPFARVKGSV